MTRWISALAGSNGALAARLLRARYVERGATAVEYALMVAFVALAIIVAVTAFGLKVTSLFIIPAGAL